MLLSLNSSDILNPTKLDKLLDKLIDLGVDLGSKILVAIVVYYVGKFIIHWLERIFKRIIDKKNVDTSVKTFLYSLINIALTILLFMAIIGILGIQTASFAALIASAGLAIGMAMKDNLGNFAGGVMILFNKPIKVGDYIQAQSQEGVVKSIGILYTILTTLDNKTVFIPNGPLSTGNIMNFSTQENRRIDISVGVDYGTNVKTVKDVLTEVTTSNPKILTLPAPFIGVEKLNDSSVDFTVKVWAKTTDYWEIFFHMNESIYEKLTEKGIGIPFPQLTVHMAKD